MSKKNISSHQSVCQSINQPWLVFISAGWTSEGEVRRSDTSSAGRHQFGCLSRTLKDQAAGPSRKESEEGWALWVSSRVQPACWSSWTWTPLLTNTKTSETHKTAACFGKVVRAHGEVFLSGGFLRGTLSRSMFFFRNPIRRRKNLSSRLFCLKSVSLFCSGGNRTVNKHRVLQRRECSGKATKKKKKKLVTWHVILRSTHLHNDENNQ